MARPLGARAQLALAYESTYGTAPGSGFTQMPFVQTTLGGEAPLLDSDVLGFGRDPQAPGRDALDADGDIIIPMDVEYLGFWLKAAFGAPTTAGVVAASGAISFSAQPAASSTMTINGILVMFVASGATGNQVNIGANLAATLTAVVTLLNASVLTALSAATYSSNGTQLLITHDTLGHVGNAFTLVATATTNGVVSGPTLTGGANTHTFVSGGWALPSLAMETQLPEVPKFAMYTGFLVDSLSWEMKRKGLQQATVKTIGQNEVFATTTQAGSLAAKVFTRFMEFQGAIQIDGVAAANITGARVTYSNNLQRIDSVRGDGKVEGIDPTMAACTGQLVARFADMALFNKAIAGTASTLLFSHVISASARFDFTVHAVYLPRPRAEIQGPGAIEATFDWQGALASSPARMATAVLTNGVAGY
jgi:Phage tail tube protein